jgi:hypothetical protein
MPRATSAVLTDSPCFGGISTAGQRSALQPKCRPKPSSVPMAAVASSAEIHRFIVG